MASSVSTPPNGPQDSWPVNRLAHLRQRERALERAFHRHAEVIRTETGHAVTVHATLRQVRREIADLESAWGGQ